MNTTTDNSANEAKQIAVEILNQLGGKRFARMTGSKDFVVMDCQNPYGVRMKLARNKTRANYLAIHLLENDTYRMEFKYTQFSMKTLEAKVVDIEKLEDVYAEDLQRFFTDVTGLYTRL